MSINTYIIEVEGESTGIMMDIEVVYEFEPGSPGSYEEPPEQHNAKVLAINIVKSGERYEKFIEKLEEDLIEYELEGGGRYNPDDFKDL